MLGGKPSMGLGMGMMVRSTSDNSAEAKQHAATAAGATTPSESVSSKRLMDRTIGMTSDRRGGRGGSHSQIGGGPRHPSTRTPSGTERDYRFREASSSNATQANASNDSTNENDGGWSKVGGRREKRSEELGANAQTGQPINASINSTAPPARTHDRFTRYRSNEHMNKDGEPVGASGERDSTMSRSSDRRPLHSKEDRTSGDRDRVERGPSSRTWDRDDRHRPSGDRSERGERRSNFPRRTGSNAGSSGAEHFNDQAAPAPEEEDVLDDTWDQPTPGCFTKAELLALWNPDLYQQRPAVLVDLDGLNVISDAVLQPVNIAPPTEEETAARAGGNWFGKNYPIKHRGPTIGGSAPRTGGSNVPNWKKDATDENAATGADGENGEESAAHVSAGKKVIRTLSALPAKTDQGWRAAPSEESTQAPTDTDAPTSTSTTINGAHLTGTSSPPRKPIASLGALPNEQQAQEHAPQWGHEEHAMQQHHPQQPHMDYHAHHQHLHQQHPYDHHPMHHHQQHPPQPQQVESNPRPTAWYYKDPQGDTQGPFTDEEMRDWYEKGYFDLKLLVQSDIDFSRPDGQIPFVPLGVWFLNGKRAFLERIPDISAQKTIQASHIAQQQHHQQQLHQQQQQMHHAHMEYQQQQQVQPHHDELHPANAWQQQQQQQQQRMGAPQPFGGLGTWGAGPQPFGQGGLGFGLAPPVVPQVAQGWPQPPQQPFHANFGAPQPQQQPPQQQPPQSHFQPMHQPQQQQQAGPHDEHDQQQRLLQQRMAMLQAQQQAAIAQAREQQLRESREALQQQQAPVAQPQPTPSAPQQVAPQASPVSVAPWSKVPMASPTQSLFSIQQQAELEEAAASRQREEDEERQRDTESETARGKPAWSAVTPQQAAAQRAHEKEQADIAKAQAQQAAEEAREAAAREQAAQKEAARKQHQQAAAAAAAAKLASPVPKTASSLQQIQEEEERAAAAAAAKAAEEAASTASGWAAAHAQPNPVVNWTSAASKQEAKKKTPAAAAPPAKSEPSTSNMTREQ